MQTHGGTLRQKSVMKEITPVAKIYTQFTSKFGIPRQSGLAGTHAKIVFEKEYRVKEAVRGLEGYSHIWLIWEFTEAEYTKFSPTVRPPRLGGNTRMGVFATRSPFRPNSLGLSCVKLDRIDLDGAEAPVLYVSGADILDGTPVYDIKPYLPFADCVPEASSGFAGDVLSGGLEVKFASPVPASMTEDERASLISILGQDPRPHYQNDKDRVYSFEFSKYRIKFVCDGKILTVTETGEI